MENIEIEFEYLVKIIPIITDGDYASIDENLNTLCGSEDLPVKEEVE